MLTIVGLVLMTSIVMGIVSFAGSRNAATNMAHQLQARIFDNVQNRLNAFMELPHSLNRMNAATITHNPAILDDLKLLSTLWLRQIQAFDSVEAIGVGIQEQGNFSGAGRDVDGAYTSAIMDRDHDSTYRVFRVDPQGRLIDLIHEMPNYDARLRPWYRTAVQAGQATWSPFYIWASGASIGLSAALPIMDANGMLLGVQQTGLSLNFISSYLAEMTVDESFHVFLMEPNGLLVATSTDEDVIRVGDQGVERVPATDGTDPFIRAAATYLDQHVSDADGLAEPLYSSFSVDNQRFFLSATRIRGPLEMNLILVAGLPESYVMSSIVTARRVTLGVTLAAMLAATLLGWLIAHRLAVTNQRLRESEQQFKKLAELAPVQIAILSLGKKPKYLYMNRRTEEVLGYTADERNSLDPMLIVHPEMGKMDLENFQKRLSGQAMPERYEIKILAKSGETIIMDFAVTAINYENKKCILTAAMDITERKQAEERIKHINKQLQKANAEKDTLFTIIAHDLRSPMSGLLALTELLSHQPDIFSEKDIRRLSTELHKNARNTFELLEDLLQWARMSQGGIDYSPRQCSLTNLVNTGLSTVTDMAKSKEITLRGDIPPELNVLVDQPMIKTVIRNILFNAIKFTPRRGGIVIKARQERQTVTVAIQDNGTGMDEQTLANIFSLKKEKRQLGTEGEKGTGLGLVLCKQFIEKHGGQIWVESEPGKGTTVFFTLPISD